MAEQQQGYCAPAVRLPTVQRLSKIAQDLELELTGEELGHYQDLISHTITTHFQKLDELPEPKLPVKYPRIPGHRPTREENPLNAWYWRCDIPGASSGQLLGKTIAIKDAIPVAGVPMMNGSRILEGYIPDVDATVVTRVLHAGGRILGKAVCEDLCCSSESFTSANGPVLHPLDPTRSTGGSSSGCAALVASGAVDMALGGDQGGSIRMPAALCGIVGLKPTFGLVPYTGIASMDFTLDHTGPMAKTVHDVAVLLEAIAGLDTDGLDYRQPRDMPAPLSYVDKLTGKIAGVRVGLVKEGFTPDAEQDVNELVRKSAERFRSSGAIVEEVSIPWHASGFTLLVCMLRDTTSLGGDSTSSSLSYYNTHLQLAVARGIKANPNGISPTMKLTRLLTRYLQEDYHGAHYSKVQNLRRELTRAYDKALESYDVLIMPTVLKKATKLPTQDASVKELAQKAFAHLPNTAPFNLSGHPAVTVNAGFSDGLPVGMMIVGRKFDEVMVLNVAHAWEKLRDQHVY